MRTSGTLLALLAVLAPAAPATATTSEAERDGTAYFWQWTDGSEARTRTFAEHAYDLPSRLPRLVVRTHPATRGRHVDLQTRVQGHWRTEDSGATDRHGAVRLALNPYCADGAWCRRSFDYRLVVDGQTAAVRVTYSR